MQSKYYRHSVSTGFILHNSHSLSNFFHVTLIDYPLNIFFFFFAFKYLLSFALVTSDLFCILKVKLSEKLTFSKYLILHSTESHMEHGHMEVEHEGE